MEQSRAYKTLEFDKILERLSGYTESDAVKKRISNLSPVANLQEARQLQRETTEAMITILKLGAPPVSLSTANVFCFYSSTTPSTLPQQ